jgi:hypothetical protein
MNALYKQHLLVWAADHDKRADTWIPAITISWKVGEKHQFHSMWGPALSSHDEALALADQLARAWVDQKM